MPEFVPGLEGVIAFETQIAEPDRDGGALRYRGVDIEDLVGRVSYGNVWGLLVDNEFNPGLPPAEPFPIPIHSGDVRVDVQSAIAMLAPAWGLKPLLDIDDDTARENLAHVSVMALSFVAQSARGLGQPMIPQSQIDQADTVVERFMIRWRGEPEPRHIQAMDAYFVSAAEHGMNASTFASRVVAWRRPCPRAPHDRGGRAHRRCRRVRPGRPRPWRATYGLRASRLPGGGPPGSGTAPHRLRARR